MSGAGLDVAKVAAARLWAATRMPYLATALFACTMRPAPDSATIAVSRAWQIDADPVVVQRLGVDELGRLLVHLTGHVLRDHAARADAFGVDDDGRSWWGRCADAEINDDLRADNCVPSVAGDQPADLGCADGGLVETYYRAPARGERIWDCGSGADGVPRPWDQDGKQDGLDAMQGELLRLGVAADIQRRYREEPGTIPGGWVRWAEAVRPSRTDWRRVLAAEIRSAVAAISGSVDYTYRRPSRRGRISPRVVLPSLFKPIPDVAIVCDTSGSMHEILLERALTEIEALLVRTGLRATRVRVLAVDTEVHAVRKVSRAGQVQLAGGGGTDMGAGLIAASELRPRPSLVVVLTDGMTPWPDRPPPGVRVVVGVLTEGAFSSEWTPPAWARTVLIDELE